MDIERDLLVNVGSAYDDHVAEWRCAADYDDDDDDDNVMMLYIELR